jgi:hypothetical protein
MNIIRATQVQLPPVKNRMGRITFAGAPMVGLLRKNHGWQVQMRTTEDGTDWADVPNGWFKTRAEAEDQAPYLCDF